MRRLLTVEDTFAITGRGLMVAPMPALDELRGPGDIDVELRLPDGTRRPARLSVLVEFVHPTPAVQRWALMFKDPPRRRFRSAPRSGVRMTSSGRA